MIKLKLYALIAGIAALFSVWRRSRSEGASLLRSMLSAIKSNDYFELKRVFWYEIIIPNYRLRTTVTLGKPLPTAYRKFSKLLKPFSERLEDHEVNPGFPNFLIIRNGALGDVLMATPVVRGLYESHNGCINIDVSTFYPDVFANSPYVRKVLNPNCLNKGIRDYDHVINLNGVYEKMPASHPVNTYVKVALGNQRCDRGLDLFPAMDDVSYISKVVSDIGCPYFVVHYLRHEWPNRNISSEVWLDVFDAINNNCEFKLIFIGSSSQSHAHPGELCEDHRERYSIQQLKLLIEQSLGFIGADSGPAHIAATTSVPIAVFYTCAHHEVRMPLRDKGRFLPLFPDVDCYGCLASSPMKNSSYYCERGDNICVSSVALRNIGQKVLSFIRTNN